MYLIMLTYRRPLAEVDAQLAAHRAFLERHYDAGHFLMSGPREPRTGGIILARAASAAAVAEWVSEDPFKQAGVADYEVVGWRPGMAAPGWPLDAAG
ncbi:GTP cyclohydrolase [Nitrogeniibacter mangrovi]|uniref:GTP cyclohydrolase n=1 Tax=Nitrogeniibacter mangrovi TaxID=2016596 RepID=A0A6C1B7C3_9RHOO|nr:GTP cyclohydrolase [Nitrogeniibacter mangrovi]